MKRDQALQFLRDTGYVVQEVGPDAWLIRTDAPDGESEIVGRVAGDDMLIAFVALLKFQLTSAA